MVQSPNKDIPPFDGSNWEQLSRLVALSHLVFLQDGDYEEDEGARCAYLASHFTGAALDYIAAARVANPQLMNTFDGFVNNVRGHFAITDEALQICRRRELEELKWEDAPVFFAEFDRLTALLGLNGHDTKIVLLTDKLPVKYRRLLAEQSLTFANYDTMRQRVLNMALLMAETAEATPTRHKKPRCGRCRKRGHTASECKAKN